MLLVLLVLRVLLVLLVPLCIKIDCPERFRWVIIQVRRQMRCHAKLSETTTTKG